MTDTYEPWTPVQVETKLAELMNAVAQAELAMRDLNSHELDAKLEYERAHVQASLDPMCPIPTRGGSTVAERDDWIRGVEFDQYHAYELAKVNTGIQKRYIERLAQQVSITQTMSKHVLAAYQVAGARGTGGSY